MLRGLHGAMGMGLHQVLWAWWWPLTDQAHTCKVCGGLLPLDKMWYCSRDCRTQAKTIRRTGRLPAAQKAFERPFRAWDGEGVTWPDGTHLYTLLANSDGEYIENENGLSTFECLHFLTQPREKKSDVWFAFDYDVNAILHDIPLTGERHSLWDLSKNGLTIWRGFRIKWIPHKVLVVTDLESKVSYSSTDTFGFFQTSFIKTLEAWGIEVPSEIKEGKAARARFVEWDVSDVRRYNAEECRLLVILLERLREAIRGASLSLSSWHGAGAIAGAWLNREGAKAWVVGDLLEREARCAYHGGRQDSSFIGQVDDVHHYDLNSAYPAALTTLPDLATLEYKPTTEVRPYGIYKVRWNLPTKDAATEPVWYPFPWRAHNGRILYPPAGEGWYHACEVQAALDLYQELPPPNHQYIQVLEGYAPEGEFRFPWDEPIRRDFAHRNVLKKDKKHPLHSANIPIKLALNSLYGKLAQGAHEPGKRPKWQCYFAAGYVTAYCRAELLRIMKEIGPENVAVCSTDGIFTTAPLRSNLGEGLGQWLLEEEHVSMLSCGSGLYATFEDGKAKVYRSRGMPTSMNYAWILRSWGCSTTLDMEGPETCSSERQFFVGMRIAVQAPGTYGKDFGRFRTLQRQMRNMLLFASGKRWPGRSTLRPPGWLVTYLEPLAIDPSIQAESRPYIAAAFEESEFESIDRLTMYADMDTSG